MALGRKFLSLRKSKTPETVVLAQGDDELTNEVLRRRISKQRFPTLRIMAKMERHSSKYQTARGHSVLWTEDDENKHEIKVFIRDTEALSDNKKWEELIRKGVTDLIIEDNENKLKKIPPQLTNIQTLRSLTLMWSKIKDIPPNSLPTQLRKFSLQKCPLKNASNINQLTNLVSLELVDNGLKAIPMEIGEMTNLNNLDLTGNHLKSLPVSFSNLRQLSVLKVCGNNLAELPDCLSDLTSLETVDFSHNHIIDIPSSIGRLANLVTLRISHNHIQALPASFRRLEKLRHAYLSHNQFAAVPEVLGDLAGLQTLNLISNKVEKMDRPIRSLTTLLLDNNDLEELPMAIFNCQLLEKLSVQHNRLASIPPQIALLERLRALYIGDNPFTKLPDDICALSELRHLVIRDTKVKDLPVNFDRLQHLSVVDVEETALDSRIIYAAKKEGVSGLMDQIRLNRNLQGIGEDDDNSDNNYDSERGSSIFDSEDDPATDNEGVDGSPTEAPHTSVDDTSVKRIRRPPVLTMIPDAGRPQTMIPPDLD